MLAKVVRLDARASFFGLCADGAGVLMFFREGGEQCQSADPATRLTEHCCRTCEVVWQGRGHMGHLDTELTPLLSKPGGSQEQGGLLPRRYTVARQTKVGTLACVSLLEKWACDSLPNPHH